MDMMTEQFIAQQLVALHKLYQTDPNNPICRQEFTTTVGPITLRIRIRNRGDCPANKKAPEYSRGVVLLAITPKVDFRHEGQTFRHKIAPGWTEDQVISAMCYLRKKAFKAYQLDLKVDNLWKLGIRNQMFRHANAIRSAHARDGHPVSYYQMTEADVEYWVAWVNAVTSKWVCPDCGVTNIEWTPLCISHFCMGKHPLYADVCADLGGYE